MNILPRIALVCMTCLPGFAIAQDTVSDSFADTIRQVTTHIGEMSASLEVSDIPVQDTLRFEPYQQLEEMFLRDDVVYLMRHGPTDWSKLDVKNVAPDDCDNQRILSSEGAANMRDLGTLLASNDILPSRIVVSQWCRNQQTVEQMFAGFDRVDPAIAEDMPVETTSDLNLLLSLQGAKNVTDLRGRVSAWEGDPDRKGPLLIVSHYTNIEELTQFRVFEGEILVLDPKRDNQVLGYIRLQSAQPDVGHFTDTLDSPLLERSEALSMIERYYEAIASRDTEALDQLLADRWVARGAASSESPQDIEGFLDEVRTISNGLSNPRFTVNEVYVTDDVVTVIGEVNGRHDFDLFGIAATGRDVTFGAIAVHRVEDGQIAESWQMADRLSLLSQITE